MGTIGPGHNSSYEYGDGHATATDKKVSDTGVDLTKRPCDLNRHEVKKITCYTNHNSEYQTYLSQNKAGVLVAMIDLDSKLATEEEVYARVVMLKRIALLMDDAKHTLNYHGQPQNRLFFARLACDLILEEIRRGEWSAKEMGDSAKRLLSLVRQLTKWSTDQELTTCTIGGKEKRITELTTHSRSLESLAQYFFPHMKECRLAMTKPEEFCRERDAKRATKAETGKVASKQTQNQVAESITPEISEIPVRDPAADLDTIMDLLFDFVRTDQDYSREDFLSMYFAFVHLCTGELNNPAVQSTTESRLSLKAFWSCMCSLKNEAEKPAFTRSLADALLKIWKDKSSGDQQCQIIAEAWNSAVRLNEQRSSLASKLSLQRNATGQRGAHGTSHAQPFDPQAPYSAQEILQLLQQGRHMPEDRAALLESLSYQLSNFTLHPHLRSQLAYHTVQLMEDTDTIAISKNVLNRARVREWAVTQFQAALNQGLPSSGRQIADRKQSV